MALVRPAVRFCHSPGEIDVQAKGRQWNNACTLRGDDLLQELDRLLGALEDQLLSDFSLSSAKQHALKKQIAMTRARRIREERRLKELDG